MGIRSIEFRGKTYIGEWIYGNLITIKDDTVFAIQDKTLLSARYLVESSSIGLYTGLTDKNGTKIFEGDIVKCTDKKYDYDFTAVVEFGNPNGGYNWGFQLKRIIGEKANTDILCWVEMEESGAFIEVIGNIHDNPDLFKGGANNDK